MKSILLIVMFCLSSGAVGSSIMAKVGQDLKPQPPTSYELAQLGVNRHKVRVAEPTTDQLIQTEEQASIVAVQGAEIGHAQSNLATQAAAITAVNNKVDDLVKVEAVDNAHMEAKLDNFKTAVTTAITVVGSILSVGLSILLFFHWDERWKRNNARRIGEAR